MWAALLATATLPIALLPAREVSGTSWAPDTGAMNLAIYQSRDQAELELRRDHEKD